MSEGRRGLLFTTAASAFITLFAASAIQPAIAQERRSVRWATSSIDSYGYKVAASMTKLVEEALGAQYTVTVHPYPQTTMATKEAMDGNAEIGYTADIGMRELYDGTSGFRNYTPARAKLVHTWYAYPMESFMAAPAAKAGQYKCWGDFSGKPVFFTTAGFMNWLNFGRIYKVLGYDFKHVQIDAKSQADALQSGTIAGAVAYTVSGRSLAPYWKETEVRMDVTVINPCPEEVAKLRAAGLTVAQIDPSKAFSKDVGVKEVLGVPILFGYNVRPDMPEDVVYKMLSAFYQNRQRLASTDAGFTALANDFLGMQAAGISANPDIAVHPGLARFLKEHQRWNDQWKIASAGR